MKLHIKSAGQKRISEVVSHEEARQPKNSKIQALVNAIVDEGLEAGQKREPPPPPDDNFTFDFKSMEAAEKSNEHFKGVEKKKLPPQADDMVLGFRTIAEAEKANELFARNKNAVEDDDSDDASEASTESTTTIEDSDDDGLPRPSPEVVNEVFHSMIESIPRTREDIIGWCSEDEEEPKESIPTVAKELYNSYKILHCQFLRNGRYEHRNDLMFLLSEMLRRGFIDQADYEKGVASLDVGISAVEGKEDEEDEKESLLQSTLNYSIKHDKDELKELLDEYKDEAGEEYTADILKLEELINVYFDAEFLDGEPILPMIE